MFRTSNHYQQSRNASQQGGNLLLSMLLCAALIGAVFAPRATAQSSTVPITLDWGVNYNGTTVNLNDTIDYTIPQPPDPTINIFNDGFDTPGMLPGTTDQSATQGCSGYNGLNSAYQPTGSPSSGCSGGIYNGQVSNGTDFGNVLSADGQSGGNGQGGPSGNPLTPESYNMSGPPTRPSGTTVANGSVSQQQTASGGPGTVPIQTICPY
ncbi:MAG TPA: hypothetical protein V6D22_10655 [Candidatus Obscuribacterales bacterium]